jgi:membrane protein YqaA with SNARE-associated domain
MERRDHRVKGVKRVGWIRRLYDWVLHWAETPYGPWALGLLAFAEASFFPIPPDPLLMALCLGAAAKSLRFAGIATASSAYVPGVTPEAFAAIQEYYMRYDFWAVFLAGLTPIPYKVFTLSAGVFSINFPIFVLASGVSRGLRFFVVAGLIYHYGSPIRRFIDRYFNLLTWVFGALLIGGFLLIKYVF